LTDNWYLFADEGRHNTLKTNLVLNGMYLHLIRKEEDEKSRIFFIIWKEEKIFHKLIRNSEF